MDRPEDSKEIRTDKPPASDHPIQDIGGVPVRMSLTDGVPIVGDCGPYDLAETMEVVDSQVDEAE